MDLRSTRGGLTRGLEIYQALFRALEPAGVSVFLKDDETMLGVDGEELPIVLRERTVRTKHQPTEKEIRDARLSLGLPLSDRWEYVPTGDFFVIVDAMRGWIGGKQCVVRAGQPIGAILATIVDALPGLAAAKRAEREERERQSRQYEAERRARFEEQQRQAAEKARLDTLLEEVAQWRQASAIRAYCSILVEQAPPVVGSGLEAWLAASLRLADILDPLPARLGSLKGLDPQSEPRL